MIDKATKNTENILCYIDDCVVHTDSIESNLNELEEVFQLFRKHKLSLNPRKCNFLKTEIVFLGHLIGKKASQSITNEFRR